jgi:hypothetical protein
MSEWRFRSRLLYLFPFLSSFEGWEFMAWFQINGQLWSYCSQLDWIGLLLSRWLICLVELTELLVVCCTLDCDFSFSNMSASTIQAQGACSYASWPSAGGCHHGPRRAGFLGLRAKQSLSGSAQLCQLGGGFSASIPTQPRVARCRTVRSSPTRRARSSSRPAAGRRHLGPRRAHCFPVSSQMQPSRAAQS